ncbi:GIY-YIG nuclease family protein [Flavobacteriaceae bacterium F08102]|nr:GIY-YIG nuclease family protein [Flavobacteriaceae bacterium F08102]
MYAVLDIETTGGKFNHEGITEIAIHRFDGEDVVDSFISLINPEQEIQPFVAQLTGINNKMLRNAPKFYEVAKRIIEITQDCVLVAHNAAFDYRMLRLEFKRLGYTFDRPSICTVELSKVLIPGLDSYKLGKLCRTVGIPVTDRHRANGDALATTQLFQLLLEKDTKKLIEKQPVFLNPEKSLNEHLSALLEPLPNEAGVYFIEDKNGEIIYIGSTRNIYKSVNKLFLSKNSLGKKLQKLTHHIRFERTGSSLVAAIKANEYILQLKPALNANPNRPNFTHGLILKTDKKGYHHLVVVKRDLRKPMLTTFVNLAQANHFINTLTERFDLSHKLLHVEPGFDIKSLSISHAEEPEEYNQKVQASLDCFSLKEKNMVILDKGRNARERSAILIENGCFKGMCYFKLNFQINDKQILEELITPMTDTINNKHLIHKYLRQKKSPKIIPL